MNRIHCALCLSVSIAVVGLAGCGSSTPSKSEGAAKIIKGFKDGGVDLPKSEADCLSSKLIDGLSSDALGKDKITDLTPAEQKIAFGAIDGCISKSSLVAVFTKALGSQASIPKAKIPCIAKAAANTAKVSELIAQDSSVIKKVQAAALTCI